jgi:selenium-binding protein 1
MLDTRPDPRAPKVIREIGAEELAGKAGYSRPHTLHCGPEGIFMSALGGANGNDGPGGVALLDHDTFDVVGAWEANRGHQLAVRHLGRHLLPRRRRRLAGQARRGDEQRRASGRRAVLPPW